MQGSCKEVPPDCFLYESSNTEKHAEKLQIHSILVESVRKNTLLYDPFREIIRQTG